MVKRVKKPKLPFLVRSDANAPAANLPGHLLRLAARLANHDVVQHGPMSARRGQVEMAACPDDSCEAPLLPGLSAHPNFVENKLFVSQMQEGAQLVAFFSDKVLEDARSRVDVGARKGAIEEVLVSEGITDLALLDESGEWFAIAGWHYSTNHRHVGELKARPNRESFVAVDTSHGIRFGFSSAPTFNTVASRLGMLIFVDLNDLGHIFTGAEEAQLEELLDQVE